MDGGLLIDVLHVQKWPDQEILQIIEIDVLGYGRGDAAGGSVEVSRNLKVMGRAGGDGSADVLVLRGAKIFGDGGRGCGECVFGYRSGERGGARIEIEEQRGGRGEIAGGVEDAQGDG